MPVPGCTKFLQDGDLHKQVNKPGKPVPGTEPGAKPGLWLTALICLGFGGCAVSGESAAEKRSPTVVGDTADMKAPSPQAAPAPSEPAAADRQAPESGKPLLDRTQRAVYAVVNNTSHWFDGFFGSSELDEDVNVSRGLLAAGTQWDERDDFDNRLRLKARIPLPALQRRTSLIFGRGDSEDFVDGSASDAIDTLPDRFNDFEDEDWLLGLGYNRKRNLARGFDFGVGASISSSIDPFARMSYRWNKTYGDSWLWRLRPRLFWQEDRGTGASLSSVLDYAVNEAWLLRSWLILIAEDDVDGIGWTADFSAYHSVDQKNAFAYSVFATGETRNEVELQDFGVELRYRRRVLREWLFLELSTRVGWPREFVIERRESNFGLGVELEMQFGDWPGRKQERE